MKRRRSLILFVVAFLVVSSMAVTVPRSARSGPADPSLAGLSAIGTSRSGASVNPGAGEGAVLSTINLVTNSSTPGSTQPPGLVPPQSILYDPVGGDLYVRGGEGFSGSPVSVIDGATDTVVTELNTPYTQNPYGEALPMAVDTSTGAVYATNSVESNISVIDSSTNRITGSIALPGAPSGIAYDGSNGYLYVSLWSLDEVVMIDGSTNNLVGSPIPVGTHPGEILVDPIDNLVFVANFGSANVSIIKVPADTVVANVVTGTDPSAMALDTDDDAVDVANSESVSPGTVSVINASDSPSPSHYNISVGTYPAALAYVAPTNEMFVGNSASGNVSVINQTRCHVVANLVTGAGPQAEIYVASDDDVFVVNSESNNVTVVNATTNDEVGWLTIDDSYSYGIAFDPDTADVYVVSEGSYGVPGPPPRAEANATVISAATQQIVASIPLGIYPYSLTFDPVDGQLLVPNPAGNDTYLVNPATELVSGVVPVDLYPEWASVDTANGEVAVLDDNETGTYEGMVTILNASFGTNLTITTGYSPTGIAFDSGNDCFYVTDDLGGNITVINGTTNRVVTVITVAYGAGLTAVAYDPQSQEVYVADDTNSTVLVIDPATNSFVGDIHVGLNPYSFATDPANDTLFVGNEGSGNLSVIDVASNTVVSRPSLAGVEYLAYDAADNLVYDTEGFAGSVQALNASTYLSAGPGISLGTLSYPHAIAYDPEDSLVYVSNLYLGTISVIGPPSSATYQVGFTETGLPPGTSWSITLNGTPESSTTATIGYAERNGSYPFTVGVVPGYTPNETAGSIVVSGGPVEVHIVFNETTYPVGFAETGLPAGTSWSITLGGVLSGSTSTSIGFPEPNGTYSWSVGAVSQYTANVTGGALTVDGASQTIDVGFTYTPGHVAYSVTFEESGLPAGTPWNVVLNGSENVSSGPSISFEEFNGSYPFTVGHVDGYTANVTSGRVVVSGHSVTERVAFATISTTEYTITFAETGLAAGLRWSVTLGSIAEVVGSGREHNLSATNGTYHYTIGNVSGYTVSPLSGNVTVDGHSTEVNVTYTGPSSSSPGTTSPSAFPPWWVWIVVAAAAVLLIVVLVTRRRKNPGPPAAPGPTTTPASSTPPGTPPGA
jgi:YVTN family beta-propeller protein